MRVFWSLALLALMSAPTLAQPFYARGDFNAWGLTDPMDDLGGGHYTALLGETEGEFFPGLPFIYKVANEAWSIEAPGLGEGNDGRIYTDNNGQMRFHFYNQESWNDGWFPNNDRRVGYEDHQQFDWEVVGSFNGWPGAADPAFALTDMGNGLHVGTFNMPAAGPQEFKFRGLTATEWDTTIGQYFRNSADNNIFNVGTAGDPWTFELDLPNGKFRYFTTAAPPPGQDGDYNEDGLVDAADYTVWRDNVGSDTPLPNDPNNGVPVGDDAYDTWKAHFGQGTLLTWMARHTINVGNPAYDPPQTQIPETNLTKVSNGVYEYNLTGLNANQNYDFRIFKTDLSAAEPDQNMRVRADENGELGINFYELQADSWADGWSPSNSHRVGYEDPEQFGWEVIGSFTGWSTPLFSLEGQGNGLYTGEYTFTAESFTGTGVEGANAFKFRHDFVDNPWDISIGTKFGNNAGNIAINALIGATWHFELDLPNGRWRIYEETGGGGSNVPEPGSLALVMLGLFMGSAALRRRR